MNDLTKSIKKVDEELIHAFKEIQQPRTPYELKHFVLNQHDTDERRYAQCVLELQIKYNNLRRAKINFEKIKVEIRELNKDKGITSKYDAELKGIDKEEMQLAVIGAIREFETLYELWQSFPVQYTRKEINEAEERYWTKRATRQTNLDLLATGRISVGNADMLRQMGKGVIPELDHIREVEKKYLETSNTRIMIAVPTRHKAEKGLPCLEGLIVPSGMQVKYYNSYGKSIAEAYNDIVMTFVKDGADFLLTIEDDTFPPNNALNLLMEHIVNGKKVIGAWYPKRNELKEGTPIIINSKGKREALKADGNIHEVYTLPMGCSLYTAEVFLKTDFPWFATTSCLTQDSFFSQKLRDAGYKLYCDTNIKCKHIDRETKKVYQ